MMYGYESLGKGACSGYSMMEIGTENDFKMAEKGVIFRKVVLEKKNGHEVGRERTFRAENRPVLHSKTRRCFLDHSRGPTTKKIFFFRGFRGPEKKIPKIFNRQY